MTENVYFWPISHNENFLRGNIAALDCNLPETLVSTHNNRGRHESEFFQKQKYLID